MRPALAQSQHRLHHGDIMRLTVPQRGMQAIPQARGALAAIPPEPLVAGLAADPVFAAQRRHRVFIRQNPSDKLCPFVHLTGLFPWHRQVPPADSSKPVTYPPGQLCYQSTRLVHGFPLSPLAVRELG